VGKPNRDIEEIIKSYIKKCSRFANVIHNAVKDIRIKDAFAKQKEEEKQILGILKPGIVCALDLEGKSYNTASFADFILKKTDLLRDISFIIGGAFGLTREIVNKSDFVIKLSDLTMQHDVALIVLFEQLYRAFTLIKRIPYHK
jgi:23S rRNA (pseudouridine1915-N3)-methyltransferase